MTMRIEFFITRRRGEFFLEDRDGDLHVPTGFATERAASAPPEMLV
jgi:hypothetical protein